MAKARNRFRLGRAFFHRRSLPFLLYKFSCGRGRIKRLTWIPNFDIAQCNVVGLPTLHLLPSK